MFSSGEANASLRGRVHVGLLWFSRKPCVMWQMKQVVAGLCPAFSKVFDSTFTTSVIHLPATLGEGIPWEAF